MSNGTAVYLDSTIVIGSLVHSSDTKRAIKRCLEDFDVAVTGSGVRAEIRRRLLKDAAYLQRILRIEGSFERVRRRIEKLNPKQYRKIQICTQVLNTVDEQDQDADRAERLSRFLNYFLRKGADGLLCRIVDHVFEESQCYAGASEVKRALHKATDLDGNQCSKSNEHCMVQQYLSRNKEILGQLLTKLRTLAQRGDVEKTAELKNAEQFIEGFLKQGSCAGVDVCLEVGDLLVALESQRIPNFYTKNFKESRFYCPALNQRLIELHD